MVLQNDNCVKLAEFDRLYLGLRIPLKQHSCRVGIAAFIIAYASKFEGLEKYQLSESELKEALINGGRYHDVGYKNKRPQLSQTEKEKFAKKHPVYTERILKEYEDVLPGNEAQKQIIMEMGKYHHERYDGTGFAFGLKGDELPLVAGICAASNDLDNEIWLPYKTKSVIEAIEKLTEEDAYSPQVISLLFNAQEWLSKMYEGKEKCNAFIENVMCGRL